MIYTNTKKVVSVLAIIMLLISTLYAAGIIAQFMNNYAQWQEAGNIIGSRVAPEFPSTNFIICIKSIFIMPYGLQAIGICIVAIGILMFTVFNFGRSGKTELDRDRNLEYSDKGTYGTAGYMTQKEQAKVLNSSKSVYDINGTILGIKDKKIISLPEKTRMNKNIAVYGASGSMKSRAFARNMIFQCVKRGESLIITDPKSELYESMSQYLRNNGYTVKQFNLVNPENSDSWHCLAETDGNELMTNVLCDVVIRNTSSGRGDHFWDNAELSLLKALCLYVSHDSADTHDTIGDVYNLISLTDLSKLIAMFQPLPISHPAKAPFHIFMQSSDSVKSGVITGLGSRLQVLQNNMIQQITSYREIDLTLPGLEKCAYFCITSDQDSTFDFLSSLFMTFVFIKLVRYADRYGIKGELPVPVHILADELANIGAIPDLKKKISTIRSRNMSISVIFQSLAQMQNRYPDNEWQEIVGNCDAQLFLGCTDEITASYISDRTGEITVGVSSSSKSLNTWRVSDYSPEYRETRSTGKRKLLTPDEVLRLPLDEALIILRGQKVLRVDKFDFEQHYEAKKLISCKAGDHVPEWRNSIEPGEISNESAKKNNMCPRPSVTTEAKVVTGGFYIDNSNKKGGDVDKSEVDIDDHSAIPNVDGSEEQPADDDELIRVDKDSLL